MRAPASLRRCSLPRWPAARRSTPPQAVGEGQPRAARRCSSTPIRSSAKAHAAHLHEQGRRGRRLRRRRRRLWLQLSGPGRRNRAARDAIDPRRAARRGAALPGVLPAAAHRADRARPGHRRAALLRLPRLAAGRRPDDRAQPVALRCCVPLSDTLAVEGTLVYDAMSGASPLYFNTLSGASGLGVTDYRTAGDVQGHQVFRRLRRSASAARTRASAITSRAPARSTCARGPTTRNRTCAFGIGGDERPHQRDQRRRAQDAHRETLRFPASASRRRCRRQRDRRSRTSRTRTATATTPIRTSRSTRGPTTRRIVRVAHALQPVLRAADATLQLAYRYSSIRSATTRTCSRRRGCRRCRAGFTLTPALRYYTQSAADFYHDPPFPQRLRRRASRTRADTRLASFGAITAGRAARRSTFADGWTRRPVASTSTARRASWHARRQRQPGHR